MKFLRIFIFLFALTRGAFASAQEVPLSKGATSLTFTGGAIGYSSLNGVLLKVNLGSEYFIADQFSVGVDGLFHHVFESRRYGLGPSATYYFWQNESWEAHTRASLVYVHSDDDWWVEPRSYLQAKAEVGFGYFVTPKFSVGSSLGLQHRFDDYARRHDIDTTGYLALQLSVYF